MLQVFICVGSSCHLKGSYQIIRTFEELIKKYKLENKVELKASFCLGQCTRGVAVKVENELIEELTISNAIEKFDEYIYKKVMV
ncbi:MAG: (2Fe-2S) ferredoxin domain-containing protein [Clostridia bacterium]|nr:(2Fe-2S) ferredoxin domain-containing protein [Clostridia bacterium]